MDSTFFDKLIYKKSFTTLDMLVDDFFVSLNEFYDLVEADQYHEQESGEKSTSRK